MYSHRGQKPLNQTLQSFTPLCLPFNHCLPFPSPSRYFSNFISPFLWQLIVTDRPSDQKTDENDGAWEGSYTSIKLLSFMSLLWERGAALFASWRLTYSQTRLPSPQPPFYPLLSLKNELKSVELSKFSSMLLLLQILHHNYKNILSKNISSVEFVR